MDDLNRMLAESMHDAAGHAPSDAGLLGSVHARSRRYHRRRVVIVTALAAAVVVAVAGIPIVTVLTGRPEPALPPAASASPSAPRVTSGTGAVRLSAGWKAPAFPYTLPATDGMSAPAASMRNGNLIAFFEATELQHHADVTITVSAREPEFTSQADQTPISVRGHAATLRTVNVSPAKQLTLYWKESSTRWIQLATDDTYTPDQVAGLADSMTSASIAVRPPFDLDLSPQGLIADTVSDSRMTFRRAGGDAGFRTVLRKRQQLTGINHKVGGHDAALTHSDGRVVLSVDVTDWDATLEITVDGGLTISDADLLRYAAGVHILNRSNPE